MYERLLHFVKYNNAFTIILAIFFFSFGISFAASPQIREGVYSSEETLVSIDNSLIVDADLDSFAFNLKINSITDDDKNYYITYSYKTLAIEDGVWKNKDMEKVLNVSKVSLDGRDLGLHVARELGENINYELSYLKRVQKLEKEKGESQKVVNVEYSGLIGKMLDPKQKVIEGYDPVIPELVKEIVDSEESNPASVILSTPYYEPSDKPDKKSIVQEKASTTQNISENVPVVNQPSPSVQSTQTESVPAPISTTTTTTTTTSTTTEATSSSTSSTVIIEPTPAPVITPEVVPTPSEMVDEELVQEVVEELLQENEATPPATESPATEAPAPDTTTASPVESVPESVPESATESTP